jgi:hypothetical protein
VSKPSISVTVWLLVTLCLSASRAQAEPLPSAVEVSVPGNETVRIALPSDSCAYPKEVRDRLSQYLLAGEPKQLLLGAAGDCGGIDRLMREGTAVVSPSMQLTMLDSDSDPTKRSNSQVHRNRCFEQFPKKNEKLTKEEMIRAIHEVDHNLTLGAQTSLGLLTSTRDAVFGGMLSEISNASGPLRQIQVLACFTLRGAPLFWTFQESMGRDPDEKIADLVQVVLARAEAEVKATLALNPRK